MNDTRTKYILTHYVSYVVTQNLMRIILFVYSFNLFSRSATDLILTFGFGLLYDAAAATVYILPLTLFLFLSPTRFLNGRRGKRFLSVFAVLMNFFLLLTATALFFFWQEFGSNFNFIAVDYLIYTSELLLNIWQSYPVEFLLPILFVAAWLLHKLQRAFVFGSLIIFSEDWAPIYIGQRLTAIVLALFLPLSVVAVRSLDSWRDSGGWNRYNAELAGNCGYEFVRAFLTNEIDYRTFYALDDDAKVLANLRDLLKANNAAFVGNDGINRRIDNRNALTGKKPNVIVITVESLNANYCGAFGATKSLTPNIDNLAEKSYIFTNMLATGTRTVRGLEALSLSVPPTPGQSIIRRKDNANMMCLGSALRKEGYATDFIYGGYGYFDNMNEFFSANGYTVKDRLSIPDNEIFNETVWGVADEILFTQVLKSMDAHHEKGEKAFEMVMTTTNHRPFTFPEGRVDDKLSGTREGSCRYADWAIGDFLRRAAEKPWFDNTVFVIVADHQARAAGKTDLPISTYHIPCLFYAPKLIPPGKNDRLISQADVAPTLLARLGISYEGNFMGQDINKIPAGEERAFISTYQLLGYVKKDTLVILRPNREINIFRIDNAKTSEYTPIDGELDDATKKIESEAISYYQGAAMLYEKGLLKDPATK